MTKRSRRIIGAGLFLAVIAGLAIPKIISLSSSKEGRAGGASGARKGAGGPVAVKAYVVRAADAVDRAHITGTIAPFERADLQSESPGKIVRIYFREGAPVRRGALLVKMDDAELRAELGRATVRKELAEAKEARQRVMREKEATSQAEYDVALGELRSAAADIEVLRAQLAKTEIRAPFAGTIGLRSVSEGSYITSAVKIATLTSTTTAKLDFSVPERYAALVRPGSTFEFTVQGSDRRFSARVYATEPNIDQQTRTLQVRATCANPGGALRPGAFAEIDLVLARRAGALMVPTQSVIPDANGAKVFVSKGGTAQPRPIGLGLRTETKVEVTHGLAAGDTVVTSGILQMRPGTRLRIEAVESL